MGDKYTIHFIGEEKSGCNGNGHVGGIVLNGSHIHEGCYDAIGSLCFNESSTEYRGVQDLLYDGEQFFQISNC
jgi:hypothetical protein